MTITASTPGYGTFRGRVACTCLIAWLPVFEAELIRRGVIKSSIDIAQLTGGAIASGGTHSEGGAADIWQRDPVTILVARQMGADACWPRGPEQGFEPHTHLVLRGCPHNGPARYQIDAVDAGFDGLGRGGRGAPDYGPRPLSGRTWRQGVEWARALQEENDMTPDQAAQLTEITQEVAGLRADVAVLSSAVGKLSAAEKRRAGNQHRREVALIRKLREVGVDVDALLAAVTDDGDRGGARQ